MVLFLGVAPWLIGVLTVVFLVVCVMLILTVLIQRPQGGGLAGAFGSGAGSGQTAFGAKTGDALTIFTIIMFAVFILSAIGLNYTHQPSAPTDAPAMKQTGGQPATTPGDAKAPVPATDSTPSPDGKPADGAGTPPVVPNPAPTETKPVETTPAEAPKTEVPATNPPPAETKPSEPKPAEPKPASPKR